MPPAHVPPTISHWIILIEKVVLSIEINQTIWIIRPMNGWCKMVLWPKWLLVKNIVRNLSSDFPKREHEKENQDSVHKRRIYIKINI